MKKVFFLLFILIATFSQAQVTVVGYISTQGVANYPTHIDSMGKGGYMSMQDSFKRNAIPCLRRKYGMAVYVQNLQKLYILKDSNCANTWIEFSGGGGGSADLQTVLNNGHFLDSERNTQGTDAGIGISNENINAFGYQAGSFSSGGDVNALGFKAAAGTSITNHGNNINALGNGAAEYNEGSSVNALGAASASLNKADHLNAMGYQSGYQNEGQYVNAFGQNAADSNISAHVNAFGAQAARRNSGTNVNAFGAESLKGNTGSNVSAFGSKAGTDNGNNNVVLFGENATASEADQLVMTNSNTKNTRISYGCTDVFDKTTTIPNKSGYFMTANFPIIIDAEFIEKDTIDYADNYIVKNIYETTQTFTLMLPDPTLNCENAGQRLVITNYPIPPDIYKTPKGNIYLDNTYTVYYRGTDIPIQKIGMGETLELYSDGTSWRSISSLPEPMVQLDLTSVTTYPIKSNGTYKVVAALGSLSSKLEFFSAAYFNGAHLTIINTSGEIVGLDKAAPVELDGTPITDIPTNTAYSLISDGTNWIKVN